MTAKITALLSDTEKRIYVKLRMRRSTSISVLFHTVYKRWPEPTLTTRRQQQMLSSYFWRLNKKLEPHQLRVVPGEARRTYCLAKIDA